MHNSRDQDPKVTYMMAKYLELLCGVGLIDRDLWDDIYKEPQINLNRETDLHTQEQKIYSHKH